MKIVDIRDEDKNDKVEKIILSDECFLEYRSETYCVIEDTDGNRVCLEFEDFDDLIKALELAKKEWYK